MRAVDDSQWQQFEGAANTTSPGRASTRTKRSEPLDIGFHMYPDVAPLCPDLLVPENTECSLTIPQISFVGSTEDRHYPVQDSLGAILFQVTIEAVEARPTSPTLPMPQSLTLTSAVGDIQFARILLQIPAEGLPSVSFRGRTLRKNEDEAYGTLYTPHLYGRQFYFSVCNEQKIIFHCGGMHDSLNAQTPSGHLLGMVERPKFFDSRSSRTMIAAAGADVGLLLLCVIGFDWMRAAADV